MSAPSSHPDAVAQIVAQWRDERPDLDPDPILIVGRISRLAELMETRLRATFAEAGLGNGDFNVLAALRRTGKPYALTPGELSRRMLVTTGAVTKRLDRLEDRGFVTRTVTEHDARGRLATLTRAGVRFTDKMIGTHLANERELLSGLPERDRVRLSDLLGRLAGSLESEPG